MAKEDTAEAAAVALAWRIRRFLDIPRVDMHKVQTQTAQRNHDLLLRWAKKMHYHEALTERHHERVYLVASNLRIVLTSQRHLGSSSKWQHSNCRKRRGTFLSEKEMETLLEKHWALEIGERYYELIRDDRGSRFSSAIPVEECDRQIAARIFIGTTHCEHAALKEIGKAVIATQTRYEVTRDNCHRFVRVFSALALCPNHSKHTLQTLPFGVEEYIATTRLGCLSNFEGYGDRVSRLVGQGTEWTLHREDFGSELCLTNRRIIQKTTGGYEDEPIVYYDEFYVCQEQTSYLLEHDPAAFSRCQTLDRSPYIGVMRFDKTTSYGIIPASDKYNYKPSRLASGMIRGPYGLKIFNGKSKLLEPIELIRDRHGVWRDGNGYRLELPKSTFRLLKAELRDFFDRTSREDFDYRVPAWKLFKLVGLDKAIPPNNFFRRNKAGIGVLAFLGMLVAGSVATGWDSDDLLTILGIGQHQGWAPGI